MTELCTAGEETQKASSVGSVPLAQPSKHGRNPGQEAQQKSTLADRLLKFGEATRRFIQQQRAVTASNEQVILLRSQVQYERQEYLRKCQLAVDSLHASINCMIEQIGVSPESRCTIHLDSLTADKNDLSQLQRNIARLEAYLQDLENHRQHDFESAVREAVRSIDALHDLNILLPEEPVNIASERSATTSGSEADTCTTHPLLRNYHEALAWVSIVQERLKDIDLDHVEDDARRAYEEDQGAVLEMSDKEFKEAHHRQRQRITVELEEAINARDAALNACLDAGINVEQFELNNADTDSLSQRAPASSIRHLPMRLDFLESGMNVFPRIQLRDVEVDSTVATTIEPPLIPVPEVSKEQDWDTQQWIETWINQSQLHTNHMTEKGISEDMRSSKVNSPVQAESSMQMSPVIRTSDTDDEDHCMQQPGSERQNSASPSA